MRFDHVIDFRDDDGTVRPAYLLGDRDVLVSRGVGQAYVLSRSRPADRVLDHEPGPVHRAGPPGCPRQGDAGRPRP
jgi:hypothetical protein